MNEKHYVIQRRFQAWQQWETLACKYPTKEDAKAAMAQKPKGPYYRVAESYTVVRYKAVKD